MRAISSLIFILSLLFLQNTDPPRAYVFSDQIEENYTSDTTSSAFYNSSWEYSFIGEYQKALWAFDQVFTGYATLTDDQQNHFQSFQPINARDYILQRAGKEKIIMINEAHHQPVHRTFTTSLLEGLYDRGYRFLGLEALAHTDTTLNERGYPVLSSGFYTQEPQFGNMIREALDLGFVVFPYETQVNVNGKEREIQQAKNIQKVIDAHPGEKFLIHCGFDHINEAEVPVWEKAMAGRIKEYTGIDPFTINQEILTEHYLSAKENPYFKVVDTLQESSVFIKKDGSVFSGPDGDVHYDVRLFHPRTTYINGRPSWLMMEGARKMYMIGKEKITIAYPVMLKAFFTHEEINAVPVDVIEIKAFSDQKALVLPEGKYIIKIHNQKGDSLQITL